MPKILKRNDCATLLQIDISNPNGGLLSSSYKVESKNTPEEKFFNSLQEAEKYYKLTSEKAA